MTEKRRVFVAIKISERLQGEIAAWEDALLGEPPFSHPSMAAIRWLRGKNLHITLVPPWYENDAEAASAALRNAVAGRAAPFAASFHSVAFGPDPRRPRLIWASGEAPPALLELRSLAERAAGARPETRPFRLHLTLARFREEDFPRFGARTLAARVTWRDEVRSIVLMESHLSPEGADYEVLDEIGF